MNILEKLEEAKKRVKQLEDELKNQQISLTLTHQLAIKAHKIYCNSNHIDCCDWYYSKDEDSEAWENSYSRRDYLKKINVLLNTGMSINDCDKFLDNLKLFKNTLF